MLGRGPGAARDKCAAINTPPNNGRNRSKQSRLRDTLGSRIAFQMTDEITIASSPKSLYMHYI